MRRLEFESEQTIGIAAYTVEGEEAAAMPLPPDAVYSGTCIMHDLPCNMIHVWYPHIRAGLLLWFTCAAEMVVEP